jgi:hypothetical protein
MGMSLPLQFALGLSALVVAGAYVWSKIEERRGLHELQPVLVRLEDAAREARILAAEMGHAKELSMAIAKVDHTQLLRLLGALGSKITMGNDTSSRMEVAANVVADDLAAAHARADAVPPSEPHGSSADAAMRSEEQP